MYREGSRESSTKSGPGKWKHRTAGQEKKEKAPESLRSGAGAKDQETALFQPCEDAQERQHHSYPRSEHYVKQLPDVLSHILDVGQPLVYLTHLSLELGHVLAEPVQASLNPVPGDYTAFACYVKSTLPGLDQNPRSSWFMPAQ